MAPELVPVIQAPADQAQQIVEDLGGPSEVTAMQRGLIDGWLKAAVAADVEFARFVRGEAEGAPERMSTYLNTCRSNLMALGLDRRAKLVTDIATYLKVKGVA